MKLKSLKVFNSVKIGTKEAMFLKSEDYDMTLDGVLILIKDKDGNETYTSLHNVPWFTVEDIKDEQGKSKSDTKRATKKKGKSTKVVRS